MKHVRSKRGTRMRRIQPSGISQRPGPCIKNEIPEPIAPTRKVMTKIYAGNYLVTDDGRVFTMNFADGRYHQQKCRLNPNGYPRANIHGKDKYVHRLVAECFIPNPRNCREVNHIDGVKTNSRVANLEWCTSTENHIHAIKTGLIPQELRLWIARRPHPKKLLFNDSQIKQIRKMLAEKIPSRVIAEKFKCSPSTIDNVRRNRYYKE